MKRRTFITLLGGAAAAWPLAAHAQQGERMRRVGVLMTGAAGDAEGQARLTGFLQGLQEFGWTAGRNARIDYRWAADNADRRKYAAELVALTPDVILASTSPSVAALQQASSTLPIVFAAVTDPVGQGFVASLARPGGNTTGFALYEYGFSAKWLELLKEIAPSVTRVAVVRDPSLPFTSGELGTIQGAAQALRVEVSPLGARDAGEIESGIAAFARGSNGGLIVLGSAVVLEHRDVIIRLAAQHRLPAVPTTRYFVTDGGLMSYGPDRVDLYRRAAGYVDRILKGERPAANVLPSSGVIRGINPHACVAILGDRLSGNAWDFTKRPPSAASFCYKRLRWRRSPRAGSECGPNRYSRMRSSSWPLANRQKLSARLEILALLRRVSNQKQCHAV